MAKGSGGAGRAGREVHSPAGTNTVQSVNKDKGKTSLQKGIQRLKGRLAKKKT